MLLGALGFIVSCVYLLLKMLFIICVDVTGAIFHPPEGYLFSFVPIRCEENSWPCNDLVVFLAEENQRNWGKK